MFVKVTATTENTPIFRKNFDLLFPVGKKKRFGPICHYYNMPSHIRPKCFKYKNTFRMNRMKQPYYKPRIAPKHKINLKNKYIKKIWVKKIRFQLLCCFYFF